MKLHGRQGETEAAPTREFIVPLKFIVSEGAVTRCQSMNNQRQVVLVPFSATRLIQLLCLSLPVDCTVHSVNDIDTVAWSNINSHKDTIELPFEKRAGVATNVSLNEEHYVNVSIKYRFLLVRTLRYFANELLHPRIGATRNGDKLQ